MFIHYFPKCSACFTDILFGAFGAGDQIYDHIDFTSGVLW